MGSNANLSASITMTNGASSVLKQVQGDIERMTKSASGGAVSADKLGYSWGKAVAGIAGATIALGTLKRVLVDSMSAAAEDQKSVTSLSTALRNLGLASRDADLQAWTSSVQAATGASDDLIRKGLTRLVSATNDVQKAQEGVLLSMDIAAGGYADTESAAKALSAAYLGNTTALSRLKLPLDKAILASGDMKAITAELTKVVGGQAAAAAQTYAGKLQRMSTAADEAKESLGYGLLAALDAVGEALGGPDGAVSLLDQLGTGLRQNGQGIATVVGGIDNFVDAIGRANPQLERFNGLLDAGLGPAGVIGTLAQGSLGAAGRAIDSITAALDPASEAFARLASEQEGVTAGYRDSEGVVHTYIGGIEQVTAGAAAAGEAVDEMGDSVEGTTKKISALAEAMGLLDTKANQQQALMSWRDGLAEFVAKPSAEAALDLVSQFQSAYDAFKDGGKKQAQFVVDNYKSMRQAIKDSGLSEAAQDELLRPLRDAKREADLLLSTLNLLSGKVVPVSVVISQLGAAAPYVTNRATGGPVVGPGTSTSDSIPAMLSNGEYVVRASTVNKVGRGFLDALNSGRLFGFASGGGVQTFNNDPRGSNVKQAGYNYMTQMSRPSSSNIPLVLGDKNPDTGYARGDILQANADAARAAADAANAAARAAEEMARAEAARLAEIHRQQQELIGQARQLMIEAGRTRDDFARDVARTSIGFGSITGFDSSGSDWAALSMRAPGSSGAGGPATSGGSIGEFMAGRLTRVKTFGDVLKRLASAGLNSSTLREIVSAGPDEGTTLGQALLEAGVSEIGRVNSIQASLEDTSGDIGAFAGNAFYAGAVRDAAGNYTRVVGANGGVDDTPIQVNLLLDGQTVVTQLLAIKRDRGGVSLGLG